MPQPILQFIMLTALAAAQAPEGEAQARQRAASIEADSVASALAELEKGRVIEGIHQFKEIVRADPTNESSYFYLSTLYTQLGEYSVAERYVQHAIDINPKQ